MSARWDLAVFDRDDQLVLVVEVKNKLNAGPEWAARLRHNILAHGIFPNAPYFLMAFPDRFYLWTNNDTNDTDAGPSYTIDARPILQPYFDQSGVTPDQISGQSLELIIASWLGELIHVEALPEELARSQPWLVDSGLYAAVTGGRLGHEVFV
jgi:hypothetical protein